MGQDEKYLTKIKTRKDELSIINEAIKYLIMIDTKKEFGVIMNKLEISKNSLESLIEELEKLLKLNVKD